MDHRNLDEMSWLTASQRQELKQDQLDQAMAHTRAVLETGEVRYQKGLQLFRQGKVRSLQDQDLLECDEYVECILDTHRELMHQEALASEAAVKKMAAMRRAWSQEKEALA